MPGVPDSEHHPFFERGALMFPYCAIIVILSKSSVSLADVLTVSHHLRHN